MFCWQCTVAVLLPQLRTCTCTFISFIITILSHSIVLLLCIVKLISNHEAKQHTTYNLRGTILLIIQSHAHVPTLHHT